MKPPAFQFYADDFLSGTLVMTNEEVGLYIRLLLVQWNVGHVTEHDITRLSRSSASGSALAEDSLSVVRAKFVPGADGQLRNHRMELERAKQINFREERSRSGKKGAQKKLSQQHSHQHSSSSATPEPQAKSSSPSPSPISGCTEKENGGPSVPGEPAAGAGAFLSPLGLPADEKIRYGAVAQLIKDLEEKKTADGRLEKPDRERLRALKAMRREMQEKRAGLRT